MCCNVPRAGWVSSTIHHQLEKYSTERHEQVETIEKEGLNIWKGVKGVIHCHGWGPSGGNLGKHGRIAKLLKWVHVQRRYSTELTKQVTQAIQASCSKFYGSTRLQCQGYRKLLTSVCRLQTAHSFVLRLCFGAIDPNTCLIMHNC
jgi:hypothetical protein